MILIGVLLISGCGVKSVPTPTRTSPPIKHEIQQGGQLVYGSLQEPDTLNPLLSDSIATGEVSSLIFSSLVTMNEQGQWIPDLATEVPTVQNGGVSLNGLVVRYKLRSGVTWHDGVNFSSDDVKFTWQAIMNRKNNIISRDGYEKIKSIDTPDPYTVVINFAEPYVNYLSLFATVLPQHILEVDKDINKSAFNRAPVGTGPFKFKEWRLAEAVVLDANPTYFRGKPTLDGITYKVIPDSNIMLLQLKSGEIDIISNIAFTQLDQIKDIAGVQAVVTPNLIWEHLDFNLDHPLFQDLRVRQAITLGIDRQAIITNVLKNAAGPATSDQSPLSWGYKQAAQEGRDVHAAQELLVQAGWQLGEGGIFTKDGAKLEFSLTFPTGTKFRETVASVIAQQLKEVGIVANLNPVDPKLFFDDLLKKRNFETAMYALVAGIDPDNFNLWNSKSIPSSRNSYEGRNYAGWRNTEVDALTEQGMYTIDIEGRKQIYFRIQDILSEQHPVVPLYFRSNIDAVKSTVANYHANPTPAGNLWNAWQWAFWKK